MDELAKWACEQLGFSACYALSPLDLMLYGGGLLLIAFFVGLLVVGFVIGRSTR
jgi:hypothetical protein